MTSISIKVHTLIWFTVVLDNVNAIYITEAFSIHKLWYYFEIPQHWNSVMNSSNDDLWS